MTIDYSHARETMVEQQVRPWDVLDLRVLDVLARLPREAFVAQSHKALAYADIELPLGHGQKMMKPVIEGRTLQALDLQPSDEVLEIGTGSGFLSACMGELAREVLSLEIQPELAERARQLFADDRPHKVAQQFFVDPGILDLVIAVCQGGFRHSDRRAPSRRGILAAKLSGDLCLGAICPGAGQRLLAEGRFCGSSRRS